MKVTRMLPFIAVVMLVLALSAHAVDPLASAAEETASFVPTIANSSKPPSPAPEGMAWIPGGEFSMGSEGKCDGKSCCSPATVADAFPIHRVDVDGFWMDTTDVTNAEFEKFVRATGYVTIASVRLPKKSFPLRRPRI
jgi:formylglycine-generating enzyme